jgi:hypothetical protein
MGLRSSSESAFSEAHLKVAVRGMQAVVAVVFLAGVVLPNASLAVNGGLGLVVTFLPAILRRDFRIRLSTGLSALVTTAVLSHSLGMVTLYETVGWWDHLTHALSGFLVAGVGYTTARTLDRHSESVSFPREFLFLFVLVFTLALGVLWEVLEFVGRRIAIATGNEPVLVQYGLEDSMLDLVFDAVGAVLFSLVGTRQYEAVVESVLERLRESQPSSE